MRGADEMPLVEDFHRRIEASGRQLGISGLSILELREKRGLTGGEKNAVKMHSSPTRWPTQRTAYCA